MGVTVKPSSESPRPDPITRELLYCFSAILIPKGTTTKLKKKQKKTKKQMNRVEINCMMNYHITINYECINYISYCLSTILI